MNNTNKFENVDVSHSTGRYPIYIGLELLKNPELLAKHIVGKQICIVTNQHIAPLYLEYLLIAYANYQVNYVILPDGESYKTMNQMLEIIDTLTNHQHHRDTTLIALGGGVIGDMTGFAAACYHRGVAFIQIPTSLLAQVDASIGGKTAINHRLGKNLVGAFHQPQAVLIDVTTLNTLPDREYYSGLAEIIKAALIKDRDFFSWLETNIELLVSRDQAVLINAIKQACIIKRDIVERDEKEQGERALLNLGHTFGHAIEQNLQYQDVLHGEAVAIGMVLAARLSCELGYITEQDCARIEDLLKKAHLPTSIPQKISVEQMFQAMLQDKKILQQRLRLILLKSIGTGFIADNIENSFLQQWLLGQV